MTSPDLSRRAFVAAGVTAAAPASLLAADPPKKVKVGVIGCGSVSRMYFPNLAKCPFAEVVSCCDIRPERAAERGKKFNVPNRYPNIDALLAGVPFDLLVNLTDMQEHEKLNKQAIEAGKHVWSEKPLANSLAAGQALLSLAAEKKVRLWGAPVPVVSPQFRFMAEAINAGTLGAVAAAHAHYGHEGPGWSAFFYEKGGGSLPDLAVYQLTTLTGLLGPAKSVVAMTSVVTPRRKVSDKGEIRVTAEDNAMVLMDHGNGVISHVQSGFNYFNPSGHDGKGESRHTLHVVGSGGHMGMVGYDWAPHGVDIATKKEPKLKREATDKGGYVWEMGASLAAECLATGKEFLATPEHALHVLEVIQATRESQDTGKRVTLTSSFKRPIG